MRTDQFIKFLSAIDDINDVVVDIGRSRSLDYVSEEGIQLHKAVSPLLKDLIGRLLNHAEKYIKVGD